MRMSQREEQIARLQAERDAYESRLPPQIRDSIERRRERGFDVPYRPIPEAALRVLEAAGPNVTQAQIQWAYDMRNRGEGPAVRSSPPDALAATPRRRDNPMAMPDEMGQLPYDEPLVGSEERVGGAPETEMTEEDMVARERDRIRSANENRTEGAPDVQVYGETPSSYMRDLQSATDMAARSDRRDWVDPGSPEAFGLESDLLQFREGMTDAEYEAAKANIRHRQRLLRGMGPDAGGYTAFNPQQPMYLGTAEDQEEWEAFLRDNPEAQERYDPAAYQANKAAADKAATQKHGEKLRAKYGGDAERAYLNAQQTGEPMDMNMVRTEYERERIAERQDDEMYARQGGDRGRQARERLQEQDARSGRSGALTNDKIIDDGSGESYGSRFAASRARRKSELDERKENYRDRNRLAGNDPRQNLTNAFRLLTPEQQQQAILGGMFQKGSTPLDVQRAQAEAQARINANQALADPVTQQLQSQQLEVQRQQQQAAMLEETERYVSNTWAEPQGIANYANRTAAWLGIPVHDNTMFTEDEQNETVRWVMTRFNVSEEEARRIVGTVASTRTTPQATTAPSGGLPYSGPPPAQPPAPTGGGWRPPAGLPGF